MDTLKSEFPKNKFNKFSKLASIIFSPVLLVCVIIYVILNAGGYTLDSSSNTITQKGLIEIKDIKSSKVFINGEEKGKTPMIYDTTQTESPLEVKLTKNNRYEWNRNILVEPGVAKTYYPILYPKDIDFEDEIIDVKNLYSTNESGVIFYEQIENEEIILHKRVLSRNLFGLRTVDKKYINLSEIFKDSINTDIRNIRTQAEFTHDEGLLNQQYDLLPSNSNEKVLLNIFDDRSLIISSDGSSKSIRNFTPDKEDLFYWGNNDTFIIIENARGLYAYDINSNKSFIIHQINSENERAHVEFIREDGLFYTIRDSDISILFRNNFEGGDLQKIELPNFDNLLKGNLNAAYDFTQEDNLLILQTKENIYTYNTVTKNFKKINNFPNEKVIYTDQDESLILSLNTQNPRQFRLYNLEKQTPIKSFNLDEDTEEEPLKVIGFNRSENITFYYPNFIEMCDIQGSNCVKHSQENLLDLVHVVRNGENIEIALLIEKDRDNGETEDTVKQIIFEQFKN